MDEKSRKPLFVSLMGASVAIAILFASYAIFSLNYFYVSVNGESMIPVFQDGDRVIFKKVDEPQRDDFIVFALPEGWKKEWRGNDEAKLIKRVALIPGQVLSWDGENWYADGEQFSYLKSGTCQVEPVELTIPKDRFFVTGDTTSGKTMDSREAFCKELDFLVPAENVINFGQVEKIF